MGFKAPAELIALAAGAGVARSKQQLKATAALTFLAGAYIAFGGMLAIRCASALPANIWGSAAKLIFAGVFPVGLLLVIVCGADLFTGNFLTLPAAYYRGNITGSAVVRSSIYSYIGNFVGSICVAYALAYASGIVFDKVGATMPLANMAVSLANSKCSLGFMEALWRGIGCNWLVCLAVYAAMAATDITGKFIALWWPIMAFVAIGFEHSVANMFFVPLGIFAGSDPSYLALASHIPLTAQWSTFFLNNLLPVTIGNIIGGALFVAGLYTVVYEG